MVVVMVAVGVLIMLMLAFLNFIETRGRDVDESEGCALLNLEVSLEVEFVKHV